MNTTPNDQPANKVALAMAYNNLRGSKGKNYKSYFKFADDMMLRMRQLGFRIVPFPSLKAVPAAKQKAGPAPKPKARAKAKTKAKAKARGKARLSRSGKLTSAE